MTELQRSFLRGRLMVEAVLDDQRETLELLAEHERMAAGIALRSSSSFKDFMNMRSLIIAGGLHHVRLYGGRSIDCATIEDRQR